MPKSSETIEADSLNVFDFLVNSLEMNPENIFVAGRSIGSGPSVYLASKRNPGALILISPFKALRETAGDIVGIFKYLLANKFNNIERMPDVSCPTLFIHGQLDKLIPFSHSKDLASASTGPTELVFPEDMDHDQFDEVEDLLIPLTKFLKRHSLLDESEPMKEIPEKFFEIPNYICTPEGDLLFKFKPDLITKTLRKMLNN